MKKLNGKNIIKTISFNEGEILTHIHKLYCPQWFEVDPCYSKGNIYTRFNLPQPTYKFDIHPQTDDVIKARAESLPFENGSIGSMLYDPPFLVGVNSKGENSGKIPMRFSLFKSISELWQWYEQCLVEFKRILKPNAFLIFKNQDTINGGKQYFSHCQILNMAVQIGFYPKDLFVLLAKTRMIGANHHNQQHARKYHCYYWVFQNTKNPVSYSIPQNLKHTA